MLGHRHDAPLLQAVDDLDSQPGDPPRVVAEGPVPHDAIPVPGDDVHHRCHVHVDADAGQFAGRNAREVPGLLFAAHGCVAGKPRKGFLQAGHRAPLLIDGDKQRGLAAVPGAGLGGKTQVPDLPWRLQIPGKQDDPPDLAGGDQVLEIAVEAGTVEADHQALAGELFRREGRDIHRGHHPSAERVVAS